MENHHPSHLVYSNLREFAKVRRYNPLEPKDVDRNEFLTELKKIGYYMYPIVGNDKSTAILISIVSSGSIYARRGADLGNMIKIMESSALKDKLTIKEVIIIVPNDSYAKKNIKKKIKSFEKASKLGVYTKDNYKPEAEYYTLCPYSHFYLNVLRHESIGKYTILSQKDKNNILDYQRKKKSNFGIIFSDNSPIVWIGAHHGDFLKLERVSHTTGTEIKYERVVNRPI
jgi:DNA-directed RNA polymerase subunit H (RpoH/RPB5)